MNKYGILARFNCPKSLVYAAEKVRDEGFTNFDCHSPFPIHGMDDAMGLKRSKLGYVIGVMGMTGALFGFGLQSWIHSIEYPMNISGKPFFAYPAYAIITFELMVLFSAFGAVFGMMFFNRIPRFHHPVFYSEKFSDVSSDAFYVSIEVEDPKYDEEKVISFLENLGGTEIEVLKDEN
ncbi:MAG: DUF3341 domain-containing protein [Rickettsiales bacterium TMED289]|nr:MAG: DUF3341 domain-containing protein [Rickettsiales bacterium TMED289]|tara:strand:+ start:1361 stop:1894 length:534 start_codon:yes stop_codon:yes gene_type:complete